MSEYSLKQQRQKIIAFCITKKGAYEDYPFHDDNWTVMRHSNNHKMFAAVFERQGKIWVNVKVNPDFAYMWRSAYKSVIPAYHMNKEHWNSIILDGSVPDENIKIMIEDSYDLTQKKHS